MSIDDLRFVRPTVHDANLFIYYLRARRLEDAREELRNIEAYWELSKNQCREEGPDWLDWVCLGWSTLNDLEVLYSFSGCLEEDASEGMAVA